jgi:hypothetical protein
MACGCAFVRFLDLSDEHHSNVSGGDLFLVCCQCQPSESLDSKARFFLRRSCPEHGEHWHRLMERLPDGSVVLAKLLPKKSAG